MSCPAASRSLHAAVLNRGVQLFLHMTCICTTVVHIGTCDRHAVPQARVTPPPLPSFPAALASGRRAGHAPDARCSRMTATRRACPSRSRALRLPPRTCRPRPGPGGTCPAPDPRPQPAPLPQCRGPEQSPSGPGLPAAPAAVPRRHRPGPCRLRARTRPTSTSTCGGSLARLTTRRPGRRGPAPGAGPTGAAAGAHGRVLGGRVLGAWAGPLRDRHGRAAVGPSPVTRRFRVFADAGGPGRA